MPTLTTDDGVRLYYEEAGQGAPIVFVHEFAGDYRAYETQMRYFSRRYRCIAFNARGYPPSDVPTDRSKFSQDRATDDIRAVLDALALDKAHVVGISMGGFATLHFGLRYAARARSLVVAGCGYGAEPGKRDQFHAETDRTIANIEKDGMNVIAASYGSGPTRVQLLNKDPRGFAEYLRQFEAHSPLGAVNTLLGVQNRRPSFYDLTAEMARMQVPTLIMSGDEEEPCLEVNLLMKRTIPSAALAILPRSGHAINLEEPALFNQLVEQFIAGAQGSDVAVSMVERRTVLARYPDNKRTWRHFRGGAYSGANLFALTSGKSRAALSLWAEAEADRKKQFGLLLHFGLLLALRAITRTISLEDGLAAAGKRLGLNAKAVILDQAEAAIDVDKPSDHALVERILADRL